MKKNVKQNDNKVKAVKKQTETYVNLIKVRIQLQKCSSYLARWPHPWMLKYIENDNISQEESTNEYIPQIQRDLGRILLYLCNNLKPIERFHADQLHIEESDAFASIDILPKVRQRILQRLDHWNQKTSLKIDSSFKVLSKTISSQIKHFLENTDTFLKQAKPSNIPENIIGYELLKEKLGTQEAKTLVQSEIYSDQERTTNKASTNAELADLLIRSYFKA
uniref:AATF leucine zipper-containing domain-containing protein n=1 Tax=Babesia bovis TaxID=5865 RepID=A7AVG3_BABBO|eukprot:XP_001609357.1 hypothetical protein [Babesia bovis T2Bo]